MSRGWGSRCDGAGGVEHCPGSPVMKMRNQNRIFCLLISQSFFSHLSSVPERLTSQQGMWSSSCFFHGFGSTLPCVSESIMIALMTLNPEK
uniref:Uncharacterized protein n=1 Tax=Knipowitschia caucasica TaxID=637954 RepID=A0AAV2JV81_KNICA